MTEIDIISGNRGNYSCRWCAGEADKKNRANS